MMLGIDFGTSNTVAALVRADGRLDTIALDAGKPTLPTALFFRTKTSAPAMAALPCRATWRAPRGG